MPRLSRAYFSVSYRLSCFAVSEMLRRQNSWTLRRSQSKSEAIHFNFPVPVPFSLPSSLFPLHSSLFYLFFTTPFRLPYRKAAVLILLAAIRGLEECCERAEAEVKFGAL